MGPLGVNELVRQIGFGEEGEGQRLMRTYLQLWLGLIDIPQPIQPPMLKPIQHGMRLVGYVKV